MSASSAPLSSLSPSARLSCAAGAVGTTAIVMASMLGVFHHGAPATWLQPTPDLMALTEACAQLPGRADRLHCVQSVVTAQRDRADQPVRLAEADPVAETATATTGSR